MKNIIIFGRGSYYKAKKEALESVGNICAYLDNSVGIDVEENPIENGKKVFNPNSFIFDNESYVYIAISNNMVMAIRQLLTLGVSPNKIMFCHGLSPEFDIYDKLFKEEIDIFVEQEGLLVGKERRLILNDDELRLYLREYVQQNDETCKVIKRLPKEPISRRFGLEMGVSVTRKYVDDFIYSNKNDIFGNVLEVAESRYSKKYGEKITQLSLMHVYGWNNAIQINLETGEGVVDNTFDCFICTQTIQMIYDIKKAVNNIYRLLKTDGVALVTISAMSQLSAMDYLNWGEYWRLTEKTCRQLFGEFFDENKIEICSYGNAKMACALLYGISVECFAEEDVEYSDSQYPVLIGVRVKK